jgi:hypothetical protein
MNVVESTTIIKCFQLALSVNGEKLGGTFERELLATYLGSFPHMKEHLLACALEWVTDHDGTIFDIAETRLRNTYEHVTGIKTKPSWEKD